MFRYCFANEGTAYKFDFYNTHYTYFDSNIYDHIFARTYGSYISVYAYGGRNTLWMKNETI